MGCWRAWVCVSSRKHGLALPSSAASSPPSSFACYAAATLPSFPVSHPTPCPAFVSPLLPRTVSHRRTLLSVHSSVRSFGSYLRSVVWLLVLGTVGFSGDKTPSFIVSSMSPPQRHISFLVDWPSHFHTLWGCLSVSYMFVVWFSLKTQAWRGKDDALRRISRTWNSAWHTLCKC